MIEVDRVSKVFGRGTSSVSALDDVSLRVDRGEIHGVIGQSGAGKSTLIRCVNRLETVSSGTIRVGGEDITRMHGPALRRARQQMGMIFQGFNLLSTRTVAANISLSLEIAGMPRAERRTRVEELLRLTGMTSRGDAYPAQLSGGQKQRVGIARALATSPAILLSDEATSALDPATTGTILDLLRSLNRELGLTILLITHEMEVIRRICHRVTVLEHGAVMESGAVSTLALRAESRVSRALFGTPQKDASDPQLHVVVPVDGEHAVAPLFAELSRRFSVEPRVVKGAVEAVGERPIGQFVLAFDPGVSEEPVRWLTRTYPGSVVL